MNITPQQYDRMTKEASPNSRSYINVPVAFVTGGLICVLGQIIMNIFKGMGFDKELSGTWTSVILVVLSALFTGLEIYEKLRLALLTFTKIFSIYNMYNFKNFCLVA